MEFGFSEEQRDVQDLARQILTEQVTLETLARFDEYQTRDYDRDLWAQLATAGLLGVAVDERYGGMGFGFTELALFIEEVGRNIAMIPIVPAMVSVALPVQRFGSDALRERWLPGLVAGQQILTAALMEELNEDPANPILTTAKADGDGWRVSGGKTCVPYAEQAERILVSARSADGVVVLLVDPRAAGVTLTPLRVTNFEAQYQLDLADVQVSGADVLVGPGQGVEAMRWLGELTSAALCAHQVGVTDKAMRMTASYTAERKQFGVPVATFQAVGHRAANCFIDVESLRLNTYQAASRLDSGLAATTEVQIAKIWAGDVGHRVSYAAQHMHGGMGIDRDYPLWRFCLWARHNEMMLGSSASQLAVLGERIAAGEAYCS